MTSYNERQSQTEAARYRFGRLRRRRPPHQIFIKRRSYIVPLAPPSARAARCATAYVNYPDYVRSHKITEFLLYFDMQKKIRVPTSQTR
ncbi:hypothetical protein EVAR_40680_1 [Eumeta japonica]|uniref:Uncharacterized protein n=1 Tax=Eumeta variegata TaxID=151549 RepID=A0A4C1XAH3_EUMVA|nr:hypothetical protein EVAR_40680_1 [Eumeta japonica]